MTLRAWGLTLIALSLGCASPLASQSARTMAKGRGQFAVELHEQALVRRYSFTSYLMGGVSGRYGVTDRFELGGRFGPSGVELQTKAQLTAHEAKTIVSVAPAVGWSAFDLNGTVLGAVNVSVPVLIGVDLGGSRELVLGPRLHDQIAYGQSGTNSAALHFISGGASAGVMFHGAPMSFMPELAVMAPISIFSARPDASGGWAWGEGRWTVQAGVAVLLGGGR